MFTIQEYSVEIIADPFKILVGDRYEYMLDLEVEEDDELYDEQGVKLRVVFAVVDGVGKISKYEFQSSQTGKYIDIEMEDDEFAMVEKFCSETYQEA